VFVQAVDITDPNPICLLLLCIHLYFSLPHYLPRSCIKFDGALHQSVSRQVRHRATQLSCNETRGCGRWGAARYGAVLAVEYVRAVLGLSRSVQGGKGSLRHLLNIKLIGQQAAKLWGFFANNAISRRDLDLWPLDLEIGPRGAGVPGPFLPSLVFVGPFVFPLGGGTGQTDRQTDGQDQHMMGPPSRKDGPIINCNPLIKVKVKGKSSTCYSTSHMRQTQDQKRFYNLGSGSWLAWANDTAAHYAAIQSPPNGMFTRSSKQPANFQQMCSKYTC